MEKSKKILIIVLVILLVLILGVSIREFVLWNDGKLDKSNELTKEEVIDLLSKGNANYSIDDKIYVKDGITAMYHNDELVMWEDSNTGEIISIFDTDDGKKATTFNNIKLAKSHQNTDGYDFLAEQGYEYKFLGSTTLYGREAIIIQSKHNNEYEKYVIDKTTGIILKYITYSKTAFFTTSKNEKLFNVKFDTVTNENIEKPNLNDYIH